MPRVKRKTFLGLVVSIVILSLSSVAQGDDHDSAWRTHKGAKEIDASGNVSFNSTTSGELSLSIGTYITDLMQVGVEGAINYEETEGTITGNLFIFLNRYLRTKKSALLEPFGQILAGL